MSFCRMLMSDFRRMFQSWNFWLSVLAVALVSLIGSFPLIRVQSSGVSLFRLVTYRLSNSFFLIMTAVVALPFGLSYREDYRNNYRFCIMGRTNLSVYCWSHVVVTASGAFFSVLMGYALGYGLMGTSMPMILESELEALRLSSREVYSSLLLGPAPVTYFICVFSTEAAGYAFLSVFALLMSVSISNSFIILTMPAVLFYGSYVVCSALNLPGIVRWYHILESGGWLSRNIDDIHILMPCIFLYFGSLICLEGLLFMQMAERRQMNG